VEYFHSFELYEEVSMRILYFGDIVGDKVLKVLKDNIEK